MHEIQKSGQADHGSRLVYYRFDPKAVSRNMSIMSKTEILEELPKLTKPERQEIRLRLAELDGEDWLDADEPLTREEKALLDNRLAAYAKNPDAGSSWEEVESRIRARLNMQSS